MPLFNFQDPDEVGQSEYRAIYDLLQDGLENFEPGEDELTREEFAAVMLEEVIGNAFAMLKKLGKQPQLKVISEGGNAILEWPEELGDLFNVVKIDSDEEDQHVLTYKGVSIYQTIKGDDMLSDCWYATYVNCNWESEDAFDVRDLPSPDETFPFKFQPEDVDWENEEHMALAWSIFLGNLTEEGYDERWHLIGLDQTVQDGDQRFENAEWKPVPLLSIGELANTNHLYRRKIK